MNLLHEAPAGYMLFEVLDSKKAKKALKLETDIGEDKSLLHKIFKLKKFEPYSTTTDAVASATALIESKLEKPLRKFLKNNLEEGVTLAVADTKLGKAIKKKLGFECEHNKETNELLRQLRSNLDELLPENSEALKAMQLGLAHSLSRYKLKFSPDKVDTMIVQSIGLLDDIDKELNTYAMRVREWYGWHFPELGKLVSDNISYAKIVLKVGNRLNFKTTELTDILEKVDEEIVKSTCEISMGTEISEEDVETVKALAQEVISLSTYRTKLFEYLKNRMQAIAPNLTVLVGELVGARLISQSGSLMNLAKAPASTVQILGAEKALFRALKTKHDTPKYGLLFHASLVGQANAKNKGKISRVLAAKASLAIRVDALGEDEGVTIGHKCREQVERRLQLLEEKDPIKRRTLEQEFAKYKRSEAKKELYDDSADVKLKKKRKIEEVEDDDTESVDEKNKKLAKKLKKKKKKKSKKDE